MSPSPISIEELRTVVCLGDLPDAHLQWLIDHGECVEYEDGTTIVKTGEPIDFMMLIVEGIVSFYMAVSGRLVHYFDFANDTLTGGANALLPYSRLKNSPGTSYALGKLRGLRLDKQHFPELEQLNPDFIQRLIGYMTERAKSFATIQLQHEKVSALGNLAAGIAHELNNPATAINRISSELKKRLNMNYELTEKLLTHADGPEMIQTIRKMVGEKRTPAESEKKLSALQRMELEDEIEDWLVQNKVEDARQSAETLSESGFSVNDLEMLRKNIRKDALSAMLSWLENLLSSEKLLKDLNDASCRISNLVGAIKSHVHMDRTHDVQKTRIHQDLENTLTLLGFKIREKNLVLTRKFSNNLPDVDAYIGELNQVWTNLIDNAIFALPKGGEICIETSFDTKNVTVKIVDNGPGIPKEIISRIFDPFFTTKKMGEGTGIGLDLANRIIKKHYGEIKVNSVPGRTEFSICIPIVYVAQPKDSPKQIISK